MAEEKKRLNFPKPFRRRKFRPRRKKIVAYDLETTNIAQGTPRPLYITAYGCDGEIRIAEKLKDSATLLEVLTTEFLIPEHDGYRFVGWNANNFDVYLVAMALLLDDRYLMHPYMTRSKSLRGLRVIDRQTECEFEFLDGMAMTGCMMKLEKFLEVFAPDYKKLVDVIDFEHEEFDSDNQKHCEYAMRDSVGLYRALYKAQSIVFETFGQVLAPTIGNMGIKIFQAHLPKEVAVQPLSKEIESVMRDYVMRGGYCYCSRKYTGKVWKYDLNQAYAAAMREAWLPDGYANRVTHYWERYPGIYRLNAINRHNRIPFYYRDLSGDAVFGMTEITDTWLTSLEVKQLMTEGWMVNVIEGYLFAGRFRMTDYVDALEFLRMNAEGGSNGAKGLMIKAIGNNSYGKTVEQLDGVEYVLCNECPEGFMPFVTPDDRAEILPIWSKQNEPAIKDYHKPQIGAFITAHVRMVVRRAALTCPDGWLYADTDCVVFDRPVDLDCHPTQYGKWKKEAQGERYRIITKKVYAKIYEEAEINCPRCNFYKHQKCSKKIKFVANCESFSGREQHAKGMNVKKLSIKDFKNWSSGIVPEQSQMHRNNLMKVLAGAEMYIERVRKGTKVDFE